MNECRFCGDKADFYCKETDELEWHPYYCSKHYCPRCCVRLETPVKDIFFSVDVETSGLNVFKHDLLSVGIATVDEDTMSITETNHWAIDVPFINWDTETRVWWEEFPEQLRMARSGLKTSYTVAEELRDFVVKNCPEPERRVFVANPVTFDFAWIDYLFHHADVKNPFTEYRNRAYDIRTAIHTLNPGMQFHVSRSEFTERFQVHPSMPHYALSDAIAQAEELLIVLKERDALRI